MEPRRPLPGPVAGGSGAARSWWQVALAWTGVALLLLPGPAFAQPVSSRFLLGVDVRPRPGGWELIVNFSTPVRYLRHSPLGRATSVQIQLSILRSDLQGLPRIGRESVGVEAGSPAPVEGIDVEIVGGNQVVVEVRFDSPQRFEVWQGENFRSLTIRSPEAAPPDAPAGGGEPAPTPAGQEPEQRPPGAESKMMSEARRALTARDYPRAILILQEIASRDGDPGAREALELLALAHERNGQRAHAVAEYRRYLELHPDGPQTARVEQRLRALLSSEKRPEPAPPLVRIEQPPLDWDALGSLYLGFRRESRLDGGEELPLDSSLYADLYQRTRVRADRWSFRGEVAGGYRYSFEDTGDSDVRMSRLFGRFDHVPTHLSATLGRQTRSSGGVLGRFDGLLASYEAFPGVAVSAVGGFPVDASEVELPDLDRYFYGASLDFAQIFGWLDAQAFVIDQRASGFEERRAVGGELRFVQSGRFASAYVDYDLMFDSLNIAQLTANWNVTPDTFVNLLFDYRNSPILTLTNGLLAAPETDLAQLADRLSMDEIRALAEDQTARSLMANVGASHRITERVQIAGDFTLSRFSQIHGLEIDGVDLDGGGFEFLYHAQVLVSDLFREGDAGTAGLRFFDGNTFQSAIATFDHRLRITRALRLNPRLQAETRWGSGASRLTRVIPSLRGDLRVWKLVFDIDCGVEWRTPKRDDGRWGYYAAFGARYDF